MPKKRKHKTIAPGIEASFFANSYSTDGKWVYYRSGDPGPNEGCGNTPGRVRANKVTVTHNQGLCGVHEKVLITWV